MKKSLLFALGILSFSFTSFTALKAEIEPIEGTKPIALLLPSVKAPGQSEYQQLIYPSLPKAFPSSEEIQSIYREVYENPVAKLAMVPVYDPENLTGFCFGRAMAAHFTAAEFGIPTSETKKLFIVGDLKGRTAEVTEWRFHVTTVIRANDGKYWAIDPIMNIPIPMDHWISNTHYFWDQWYLDHPDYDKPQAKYYLTHANAILPDIRDFKEIPDETGDTLIELSFNPEENGFTKLQHPTVAIYDLTDEQTDRYFLVAGDDNAPNKFDFERLNFTNGFEVDYNDYFFDLFYTYEDVSIFGLTYNN